MHLDSLHMYVCINIISELFRLVEKNQKEILNCTAAMLLLSLLLL